MFLRSHVLFFILILFGAGVSSAVEETVPAVSEKTQSVVRLEDLIHAAELENSDIIVAKAEWLAQKKRVWIDSSLPDPMAGFDIMGAMRETRTGPEKNRFSVSQEVPFPLKLWEKGKIADDQARAAYQRYLAVRRDVANHLTKLYYDLYFEDASLETIEEVKELLKNFSGVAEARYSNLSGTQRDVAKAQAEVSMSLEKFFVLTQARQSTSAMIKALLNHDPLASVGKAALPEKPALNRSLPDLINLAVQNRQEIKEMEALVSKSRRAKTLAKLDFIPDVNVSFEYTQVGSGSTAASDDGKDSWMFPLRINLPIWWNRNVPAIQEAQKIIEANEARLKKARHEAFHEVEEAYYQYDSAMKIVELYETAIIPQAQLALSSDQAGYEAGKTDFLNLLDSERVFINAKLTHIQMLTEALKSHADLVRATGLDFARPEEHQKSESDEDRHEQK